MKYSVLFAFVIFSLKSFSQDAANIKQIDSLVKLINNSNFKTQRDTIKQDHAAMGFSSQAYLTMVSTDTELKKYINDFHSISQASGKTKKLNGANEFYFDQNKLIKVDEFMTEGDEKFEFHWYFANEKPIYDTLTGDMGIERGDQLLKIAKSLLDGFKASLNSSANSHTEYRQAPYSTDTGRVTKTYVPTGFYLLTKKLMD
jgi:hypothetical protein